MLLNKLRKQSNLPIETLMRLSSTASKRYAVYEIKKKSGGTRQIEQPTPEIKSIQRWVVRNVITLLPVHASACAYRKNIGVRRNAEMHVGSKYTLRMDFADYFPSIKGHKVDFFLRSNGVLSHLSDDDFTFIRGIVCRNDRLTIGAPSSPALTNALMYSFDVAVNDWCLQNRCIYTRYADDLFVSSDEAKILTKARVFIENTVLDYPFAELKINTVKTAFLSRRYRRSITGLVITPNGDISIGMERKEKLKKDLYEFGKGRLSGDLAVSAYGMVCFVMDVEPNFFKVLERKYSKELLSLRAFAKYNSESK